MARRRSPGGPSAVLSIRLSPQEKAQLDEVIRASEETGRLAPGTISPAAFVRSALLKNLEGRIKVKEDASGKVERIDVEVDDDSG